MEIPEDVIVHMMEFGGVKLAVTCQYYYKMYDKYKDAIGIPTPFKDIKLRYNQYAAVRELKHHNQSSMVLCAPFSFGKTITAIYYIFTLNVPTIVSVPPTVLKTWVGEVIKLGLYHSNPAKSKVLIYHNSRPAHYDYCKTHKGKIIITTNNTLGRLQSETDLLVFDEGHHHVYHDIRAKQVLRLTAEHIPNQCIVKAGFKREKVPTQKYHWHIVGGDNHLSDYRDHISQVHKYRQEYEAHIINTITQYHKTCIFVDQGEIGHIVLNIIATLKEYKIYSLKSSLQALDKHLKYAGKSILLLSSTSNEGLNLLVDNIIMIKPDIYNITRIKQTIGRVLRINNPHRHVNIHFITNGKLGILKLLYAITYTHPQWTFGYDDSPPRSLLLKSETILKLVGYTDVLNYNLTDYCIIFDMGVNKLDWWTKHQQHSKLTSELINLLY